MDLSKTWNNDFHDPSWGTPDQYIQLLKADTDSNEVFMDVFTLTSLPITRTCNSLRSDIFLRAKNSTHFFLHT